MVEPVLSYRCSDLGIILFELFFLLPLLTLLLTQGLSPGICPTKEPSGFLLVGGVNLGKSQRGEAVLTSS